MPLKLQYSPNEQSIRSVDDLPGIVMCHCSTDAVYLGISSTITPPTDAPDDAAYGVVADAEITPVPLPELFAAIDDVTLLATLVCGNRDALISELAGDLQRGRFARPSLIVEFLRELQDAAYTRLVELDPAQGGGLGMPLKIEISRSERILRSVDDHPGVLMVHGDDGGACFAVCGSIPVPKGGPKTTQIVDRELTDEHRHLLTTEEVVEAIDNIETLASLAHDYPPQILAVMVPLVLSKLRWDVLADIGRFLSELDAAAVRRAEELNPGEEAA